MFNHLKFKQLRKEKKLSIEEIAVKIQSTKGTVYGYQSGSSKPSEEVINKLAAALSVDSSTLKVEFTENHNSNAVQELRKEVQFLKKELDHWKTHADFLKRIIEEKLNLGKLQANRNATEKNTITRFFHSVSPSKQFA